MRTDRRPGPGLSWMAVRAAGLLLAAALAQATPQIQTWQTANGARVLFVAAPELPMVDLRVVLDAGSARDGAQPGLASLTAAMLAQGAGDWDADTLAERVESVGAQLSASADLDLTALSMRSLTQGPALDIAVDTLASLLHSPRFAPEDLERVRRSTLVALSQSEESPGTLAQKALMRSIFGTHPYAAHPSGTRDSVQALTREDIVGFHARWYQGANAVLAIVGALERAEAESLAERAVGALPTGRRAPKLPEVPEMPGPRELAIPFRSSQTSLVAGQPGMRRGDPDYFPLLLGNHILGGSGPVSLLMDEVREKRGLSYSTYSQFLPLAQTGPFLMGLQTRNDQTQEAREVMLDTLQAFVERGPTEAQLAAAKKNLTGGFPLKIAENSDIVAYLAVIGFYGLPLDYLDRFVDRVESVSAAEIREAFARRIRPKRLAWVSVGAAPGPQAKPQAEPQTDPEAGPETVPKTERQAGAAAGPAADPAAAGGTERDGD